MEAITARFPAEEFALMKKVLLVYEWGLKSLITKLDIMQADLANFHSYNPIEHIKCRIKSPESIAAKLKKLNLAITADNARENLRDLVGIRVICRFARDVYALVDMFKSLPDLAIVKEKDYISNAKPSGYRSYHLIAEVPVFYSGHIEPIPVEIQVRTEAMDFWATLEHQARYKYSEHIPKHLCDELVLCADKIAELDDRMFLIHDIISLINQ